MRYEVNDNIIKVFSLDEFSIKQIFDCGQIFRYEIFGDLAFVVARDKFALIKTCKDCAYIYSENAEFFANYFDLKTGYGEIKEELSRDEMLEPCCEFGYGIRILKQDLFEMIVSFIVSANNNIKRIKKSLNEIARRFGRKTRLPFEIKKILLEHFKGEEFSSDIIFKEGEELYFYTFPTLQNLKLAEAKDFVDCGLGYRAEQLIKTLDILTEENLNKFKQASRQEKFDFLISLSGVGSKVANCVLLFGDYDTSAFPVDTWINKVYNNIYKTNIKNRKEIENKLINKYKNLSGYAQQYFFYFYRENNIN